MLIKYINLLIVRTIFIDWDLLVRYSRYIDYFKFTLIYTIIFN